MCKLSNIKFLVLVIFILKVSSACKNHEELSSDTDYNDEDYHNPIIAKSLPDPIIIKALNGDFFLYATEDIRNTPIHRSKNLVEWEFVGTAFNDATRPTFEANGGIWAPDINYIGGKYVLYYSMSVWGGEWTCGIGVAISELPEGPFTDRGKLFRSNEIGVQNSIDPFYMEENGKHYLFWGSFRGIYVIELTEDGLALKPGVEKLRIAGTAYEGVNILKKDDWYYLFASIGTCCEGIKSTYTAVVGRSNNLFGPYLNKSGQNMMNNRHEVLIHENDRFVGTGHNSEIVSDDAGRQWILYHAVDRNNPRGRVLMLVEVQWRDDWPFIERNSPSLKWVMPSFVE
jgi:arabinan endo-1,5-alpha-L-arabinosidase